MSRNFLLTSQARDDVLDIWEYLAVQSSIDTADEVISHIYEECEKLGSSPNLGHWREDLLGKEYRFWRIWSYLIAYRWQKHPIEIIAIVHGARDLEDLFDERGGPQPPA